MDETEAGKIAWRVAIGEFYEKFDKDLKHAEEHMTDIKRMDKPTDLICEKCGKPLVIKWGKHGSFIACTGYPDCTYTRELTVDLPDVDKVDLAEQGDEEYCENCGRPTVLKKGRFGTFFACTRYPDCKTTKPIRSAGRRVTFNGTCRASTRTCGFKITIRSIRLRSSRRKYSANSGISSRRSRSGGTWNGITFRR